MVTGASGFVGWNAARYFARRRYDVVATYGSLPHYLHNVDGARIVQMDLLNDTSVGDAVSRFQPSCILHCAAKARPQRDTDESELVKVNAAGTARLASHAARYHIPIIYLSTDLVYPANAGLVDAATPARPATSYGLSKLMGEEELRRQAHAWVIIRSTLMYGQGTGRSNSFSQFLDRHWDRGESAPVFTDQYRPFLFVNDLLDAVELLLRHPGAWYDVHLCGGPERLSRFEFAVRYAHARGVDPCLVQPLTASQLKGYIGGASNIDLDTTSLRQLGWQPRTVESAVTGPSTRPLGNEDGEPEER